jgi:hypothetical protein
VITHIDFRFLSKPIYNELYAHILNNNNNPDITSNIKKPFSGYYVNGKNYVVALNWLH